MIGLAVCMELEKHGFGTYGEDIFWNVSPIMDTGQITAQQGIWVNSIPTGVSSGNMFTDTVTISTRFRDPLKQGRYLLQLLAWITGGWRNTCVLSTAPIQEGVEFKNCSIRAPQGVTLDAVDNEGRWVESLQFDVSYQLPDDLPPID